MHLFCSPLKFFLALGFFLILPLALTVHSQVPVVHVVVNTSVSSNEISVGQVRRIFSMRQTAWSNNQAIKVYVLESQNVIHQTFSTKVLGLFPYQLDRIWNKLVYSGLGEEPIKLQSEQEMLEKISQQPGAIGYLMQNVEDDRVKVIRVVKE